MADAAAVPSHHSSDAPMEVQVWVPLGNGAKVLCCMDSKGTLEGVPDIGF